MTKEEVAEIMTYCKEHQMCYKDRLEELGIPKWRFYDAKSHYAKEQEKDGPPSGEFFQLTTGDSFVPVPSFAATTGRPSKEKKAAIACRPMNVELRTPTGTMMRIQGEMDTSFIQAIIHASSSHV